MNVSVIGITGGVGGLLAQKVELASLGVTTRVGDLSAMTVDELAAIFTGVDAVVFAAGSNGGITEVTAAIDGDGVTKATRAAHPAGVDRLVLVSVLPESWRERELGDEVEYYFGVKKEADVILSRSDLDSLILRAVPTARRPRCRHRVPRSC